MTKDRDKTKLRILRALNLSPLYHGALMLIIPEATEGMLRALIADKLISYTPDSMSYRLTEAGREVVTRERPVTT